MITQFRSVRPSRRCFDQSASLQVKSYPAHESTPLHVQDAQFTLIRSNPISRTLSPRLTKSTPVHDPYLDLPFLPFYRFRLVPISDKH